MNVLFVSMVSQRIARQDTTALLARAFLWSVHLDRMDALLVRLIQSGVRYSLPAPTPQTMHPLHVRPFEIVQSAILPPRKIVQSAVGARMVHGHVLLEPTARLMQSCYFLVLLLYYAR